VFGTSASTRESALRTVTRATTPAAAKQQASASGRATPRPSTSLYVRYAGGQREGVEGGGTSDFFTTMPFTRPYRADIKHSHRRALERRHVIHAGILPHMRVGIEIQDMYHTVQSAGSENKRKV